MAWAEPASLTRRFAFAVDGSRSELPRTKKNEAALPRSGRRGGPPQLYLTALWHLGLALPWSWRVGPGNASERGHLRAMLGELPPAALLVMDAGFVGYDLIRTILGSGHSVLIRVGANARLLGGLDCTRRGKDMAWLWPRQAMKRGLPPVALRLIRLHAGGGGGRSEVCLLTNLSSEELPGAKAARLYTRRWGVEVFYRTLKQTMERRKLRSAAPTQALLELEWLAAGAAVLGLWQTRSLLASGKSPRVASAAGALEVTREAMREPGRAGLGRRLSRAVLDGYARRGLKAIREHPRKKRGKPPGPPKITRATKRQATLAKAIRYAGNAP